MSNVFLPRVTFRHNWYEGGRRPQGGSDQLASWSHKGLQSRERLPPEKLHRYELMMSIIHQAAGRRTDRRGLHPIAGVPVRSVVARHPHPH